MIFKRIKQTLLALTLILLFVNQAQAQSRIGESPADDFHYALEELVPEQNQAQETPEMLIPNAFTPNQDGINDFFGPSYAGELQNYSLMIFDRYGRMIFNADSPRQVWDGTLSGRDAHSGVYIYAMSYVDANGESQKESGSLTLLR